MYKKLACSECLFTGACKAKVADPRKCKRFYAWHCNKVMKKVTSLKEPKVDFECEVCGLTTVLYVS